MLMSEFINHGVLHFDSLAKNAVTFSGWPRAIASKPLRTWMKQEQSGELKASLGANKLTTDQLRIRELERELSIAKTERDILMARGHVEKATAFFAKESK